ncbi:MAG: N-acetylneuraminate synthase, partial [Moorea sp. SIO4G2]|nr:N-acetylneuraminate synthase [Moorena sp. SIO4G2]
WKKLVATDNLPVGHVLRAEDIAMKSPGDGLPPYELDNVIGKVLTKPLRVDESITLAGLVENVEQVAV